MSRPHPLALAAGFFSIVPMPPVTDIEPAQARKALAWFPVLGLAIGLLAGAVGAGVLLLSGAHLLAAALTVITVQLLVGAMHLDGLADSVDGLAALGSRKDGRDAARALEIMRAPDIGAMGVVAIVLVLLAKVGALAAAPDPRALLVLAALAPAVGRIAALAASRRGVPAVRPGGFGALFANTSSPAVVLVEIGVVTLLVAGLGWWLGGMPAALGLLVTLLITLTIAEAWTTRLVRTLGGVTGDIFGALIELGTTVWLIGGALTLGR